MRRSGKDRRGALAAALLLAVVPPLMPSAPLHAAQSDDERVYSIPAQPLAQALATFARESGVDIFFETGLAKGRLSAPLDGRYSAAMALRALLAGTGLDARFTDRRSAYVFSPEGPRPEAVTHTSPLRGPAAPTLQLDMAQVRASKLIGRPDPSSFNAYAQRAVSEIRSLLNAEGGFSGPKFNVAIVVRIDMSGQIAAVGLTPESRDRHPEREADIRARLAGRNLSQAPPEGFALPLRFEIRSVGTPARGKGR